jgi:hypothetical protein
MTSAAVCTRCDDSRRVSVGLENSIRCPDCTVTSLVDEQRCGNCRFLQGGQCDVHKHFPSIFDYCVDYRAE